MMEKRLSHIVEKEKMYTWKVVKYKIRHGAEVQQKDNLNWNKRVRFKSNDEYRRFNEKQHE